MFFVPFLKEDGEANGSQKSPSPLAPPSLK